MAIEERGKSVPQFCSHIVGTKDRAANYYGNEDCGNEIMSKTKLESIT
jgi:hypothetical protein